MYLDFSHVELPDSCFFDYDHLNSYGAAITSKKIANIIKLINLTFHNSNLSLDTHSLHRNKDFFIRVKDMQYYDFGAY